MTGTPHLGFILAAYGVTALVLVATTLAILLDGRAQKRMLARIDHRPNGRTPALPEAGESQ